MDLNRELTRTDSAEPGAALYRGAGVALVVSGLLAIPMVILLIAMFVGFALGPDARPLALTFGAVNDALAIGVYGLALPTALALHRLLRPSRPGLSAVLAIVGALGCLATIWLQWLLVSGALTFEEQIGPVSIALLAVGAWMVATGWLGQRAGLLPHGLRNGILGALYLGYPVWAIDLGRRLQARARG